MQLNVVMWPSSGQWWKTEMLCATSRECSKRKEHVLHSFFFPLKKAGKLLLKASLKATLASDLSRSLCSPVTRLSQLCFPSAVLSQVWTRALDHISFSNHVIFMEASMFLYNSIFPPQWFLGLDTWPKHNMSPFPTLDRFHCSGNGHLTQYGPIRALAPDF